MVTPDELLALARSLSSGAEPQRRAAISRSYYAAFHHLRQVVEERVGLPRFGTSDDHRDLLAAMQLLEPSLANDLELLRRHRNVADYELAARVGPLMTEVALRLGAGLLDYS